MIQVLRLVPLHSGRFVTAAGATFASSRSIARRLPSDELRTRVNLLRKDDAEGQARYTNNDGNQQT